MSHEPCAECAATAAVGSPAEAAASNGGGTLDRPGPASPPADPGQIQAQLGAGRRLAGDTRARMESVFGTDFSRVQLHTDSRAAGLADRYNARAFTVGPHVAFAAGEYRAGTPAGDSLLAHELAHVVQQRGAGPSSAPRPSASGPASHTYAALEKDAERSAARATAALWHRGEASDSGREAMPALRSGLELQRSPKCQVQTAPSYNPNGNIEVVAAGNGRLKAHFAFGAKFDTDEGNEVEPRCCELRQYIKWDEEWKKWQGKPHAGFDSAAADTWYEDRDKDDHRYGHRSGGHMWDTEWDKYSNPDRDTGDTYSGSDTPRSPQDALGKYNFKLTVVDVCNDKAVKATSSTITVNWGASDAEEDDLFS